MGSCCSGNRHLLEIKRPYESGPQGHLKAPNSVNTGNSLTVDCPYSHCNVLIWTKSPSEFLELFPEQHQRLRKSLGNDLTFNLISIYSYSNTNHMVIDVLVSFIRDEADLEKAKSLISEYSNICIHIAVSQTKFSNLGKLILVSEKEEIFNQVYEQQLNLERIMKKIFTDMSDNFNYTINQEELLEGLRRENPEISTQEIQNLMHQVDKNNDGTISFNEFSYWWKRGRQGKSSYLAWTKSWAERINHILPMMSEFSEHTNIDRGMSKKSIKINAKEGLVKKSLFTMRIGKSAKREEILRWPEDKLDLVISEMWIAFAVTGKSESAVYQHLRTFEDMMNYIKFSLFSTSVRINENLETLRTDVKACSNQILFSVSLDLMDEQKSSIFSTLNRIQQLLKSPSDDFVYMSINSDLSLCEMDSRDNKDFLASLGNGSVCIDSEHWKGFSKAINVSNKLEKLLKDFLSIEGESLFEGSCSELHPFTDYLKQMLKPISTLKTWVPMLEKVLTAIEESFEPKLTVFMRYLNFGVEIAIESQDLVKFIKNIE